MKKVSITMLVFLFVVSSAFAQFVPTTMSLTGQDVVNYDFDGSDIEIPITVAGTPAEVVFCVFTKDQGENIGWVENGFLSWHYVNNIDTCVYFSDHKKVGIGDTTINWDGKDQDGGTVAAGDYYYYLWGSDHNNPKVRAVLARQWMMHGWYGVIHADHAIVEYDYEGNPHENPIIYFDTFSGGENYVEGDLYGIKDDGYLYRPRWKIGNDPYDMTLMETTYYVENGNEHQVSQDPNEDGYFIVRSSSRDAEENRIAIIRRLEWISGGESVVDTDWGDNGAYTFIQNVSGGWDAMIQGMEVVNSDILLATNTSHYGFSTQAELYAVDPTDGTQITTIDTAEWFVSPDSADRGGRLSHGPNQMNVRDGQVQLGSHGACAHVVINPTLGWDIEEWLVWANGNGDYYGDRNWEEGSEKAWVCLDSGAEPHTYQHRLAGDSFALHPTTGLGNISYTLYAPDGTGLGWFTFVGEGSGLKHMIDPVDYDSAYDGLYTDNLSGIAQAEEIPENIDGVWYVAYDTFKGIITSEEVSVDAAVPSATAVAQNSPNPFNPTTTISYTLAEAGIVSVDIFNVAGQKVDTVINDFIDAGSHSVVWDASDFSAGVYFYTVKSGDFSKTMKMTLIK